MSKSSDPAQEPEAAAYMLIWRDGAVSFSRNPSPPTKSTKVTPLYARPVSLDREARKIVDKVLDLVVGDADAVFADDRNDLSDRRSIRAFADRYRNDDDGWRRRAILALIEGRT